MGTWIDFPKLGWWVQMGVDDNNQLLEKLNEIATGDLESVSRSTISPSI